MNINLPFFLFINSSNYAISWETANKASNFLDYCISPVKHLYDVTTSLFIEKFPSEQAQEPRLPIDNAVVLHINHSDIPLLNGGISHLLQINNEMKEIAEKTLGPNTLLKELVLDAPQDQKDLLSTVTEDELVAIKNCYGHPDLLQISAWIKSGDWNCLIEFVRQQPDDFPIYSILKAAYCQGVLGEKNPSTEGIDNLATAYCFLAPLKSGQEFRLIPFEEIQQEAHLWDNTSNRWNIKQIPENQRYFILVERSGMSSEAVDFTMSLFNRDTRENYVAGAIGYYITQQEKKGVNAQGWALGSAAFIRRDKLLKGHPPIFGRGLRPVEERFTNLLKGALDFALCEPTDVKPGKVHGVSIRGQGNLVIIHDGFHAFRVVSNQVIKNRKLLEIGQKSYQLISKGVIPYYSEDSKPKTYDFLNYLQGKNLTKNDWIRFLLMETVLAIQDGEVSPFLSPEGLFVHSINTTFLRIRNSPFSKIHHSVSEIATLLNQYLEEPLGISCISKAGCLIVAE